MHAAYKSGRTGAGVQNSTRQQTTQHATRDPLGKIELYYCNKFTHTTRHAVATEYKGLPAKGSRATMAHADDIHPGMFTPDMDRLLEEGMQYGDDNTELTKIRDELIANIDEVRVQESGIDLDKLHDGLFPFSTGSFDRFVETMKSGGRCDWALESPAAVHVVDMYSRMHGVSREDKSALFCTMLKNAGARVEEVDERFLSTMQQLKQAETTLVGTFYTLASTYRNYRFLVSSLEPRATSDRQKEFVQSSKGSVDACVRLFHEVLCEKSDANVQDVMAKMATLSHALSLEKLHYAPSGCKERGATFRADVDMEMRVLDMVLSRLRNMKEASVFADSCMF